MELFQRLFRVATLAGVIAGLFATLLHQVATVPLIERAEVYEQADAAATDGTHLNHAVAGAEHEQHHASAWQPRDGVERLLFTALTDVLTGIGFALLLVSVWTVGGLALDWRRGLWWGLGAFIALSLAPGLGLPPELPGTAAAELAERQLWWIATALMTSIGLAVVVFSGSLWRKGLGLLLIALPHLHGAPAPLVPASLAPPELSQLFLQAAWLSSLLFWLVLGAVAGLFYGKRIETADAG